MTTTMQHPAEYDVRHRLEDLGETADQVAQTLFESGVRGYPGSSVACPLATWLCQLYPDTGWVVSSSDTMLLNSSTASVRNPAPVAQFVEDFDEGKYADLYPDTYDHSTSLDGM